jgi:hypothetical protein
MISTLRISHKNYPSSRITLDLYNDNQTDKLIRALCDKYRLTLIDVSKSVHSAIDLLENYKLERLRYPQNSGKQVFEMTTEE